MFFFFTKSPKYDFSGKYSASDIAKYVVGKCTCDNSPVTNLQLQKILYYLQVNFLQEKQYALFREDIEAWQFGPVVRVVYRRYCGYGSSSIYESEMPETQFSNEEIELMNGVIKEKRSMKPWDLVRKTHEDGKPWDLIYRDGDGDREVIPKDVIATYG